MPSGVPAADDSQPCHAMPCHAMHTTPVLSLPPLSKRARVLAILAERAGKQPRRRNLYNCTYAYNAVAAAAAASVPFLRSLHIRVVCCSAGYLPTSRGRGCLFGALPQALDDAPSPVGYVLFLSVVGVSIGL